MEAETTMRRRSFIQTGTAALAVAGLTLAGSPMILSDTLAADSTSVLRQSINANVRESLMRLYDVVKRSKELVAKANGVLVFPEVLLDSFIQKEYGEGALHVGGKTAGYYSMMSGSLGLQNEQSKDVIFLFMTRDALNSFRNSKGWSVGGSVPLLKVDADGEIHKRTATAPVEAIVLTNSGLMGDVSVSGINVSRMKI
jgi:lipid-binding SYLF domain-containing protein